VIEEQSSLNEDRASALVRKALANSLSIDATAIAPHERLQELPGADSVRLLQIIADLERHLGLEFDDEEIFRPHTFEGLVTMVGARMKTANDHV
jgi:acyl carrier protein